MNWEVYEKLCAMHRMKNEEYLETFKHELLAAGLTQKTIQNHLSNVEFYINTFLLREEEPLSMADGCGEHVDWFLGDFFIRKCLWSTPSSVKSTAASLKKFYKCMEEMRFVSDVDYNVLCETIKINCATWQRDCKAYNDSLDNDIDDYDDYDDL